MAKNKNIQQFQQILLSWFAINGRDFPWRKKGLSNYQLIIAEALLQRTKAETVSKFYTSFIKTFPDWFSIFQSDITILEEKIKPIGLYRQRAIRLKKLAIEMEKRNGKLPKNRAELEALPFMGQYLANAVELMIFKKPSPLIDVNMARLLERYYGKREKADIRYDPYLQNLAKEITFIKESKELNWAILDFSALVCKAQKPACNDCPLQENCLYFNQLI